MRMASAAAAGDNSKNNNDDDEGSDLSFEDSQEDEFEVEDVV